MKIKQEDVKGIRERTLKENKHICPLCEQPINPEEAHLDHDHKTGRIRNVLHRECNNLLGKFENYINRYGKNFKEGDKLKNFLGNVRSYIHNDYSHNPFHYKHKTETDKLIQKHRQAQRKAKTKKTKEKYKLLIKELRNESTNQKV